MRVIRQKVLRKEGGIDMITISWSFLILIIIIAGLWVFTLTRDDYGDFSDRDLWGVLSLILTIILIIIYGGIFWW